MAACLRHSMHSFLDLFAGVEKQIGIYTSKYGAFVGSWSEWHYYECFEIMRWLVQSLINRYVFLMVK